MHGAGLINKPAGITSHAVVSRVRRATGTRRVGHAGTLDPFATGVLVCCIGRATRLVQFLVGLDKEYIATVRLGYATDTQDRTGKQITPLHSSNDVSLEDLRRALGDFTGPQLQTPPMFSAKKVAGEKLYRAARAGREIQREPASINVYSLELSEGGESTFVDGQDGSRDFSVRVRCSSGTYVRTLAHDLGQRLGAGAHLAELRRTEVGHLNLARSLSLTAMETMQRDDLIKELIDPSEVVSHLPLVTLDDNGVRRVTNGQAVPVSEDDAAQAGRSGLSLRMGEQSGRLVAVGTYDSSLKVVHPRVVLGVEVV